MRRQVGMIISLEEQADGSIKIKGRLGPAHPALEETVSPDQLEETLAAITRRLLEQAGLKVEPAPQ